MKTRFTLRLLCLIFFLLPGAAREGGDDVPPVTEDRGRRAWSESPKVYLIPVRQEIMHPQLFLMRRGVEQARAQGADAIVLLMDTPGGRVDVMRKMVNPIIDLDIPTYTLVENEKHGAISAGAIIAMSTDHIYMTPLSNIGDAMPIVPGQSLEEAEREKIESYMDAIVRSIAQAKGRDEGLIRAMVRKDIEFALEDGTVISEEGQILTLTSQEAARIRPDGSPLLSEATVSGLDEMLERIGLEDAERIELLPSVADDLALFITRIAPILIAGALLLVYTEVQSPGMGWAGGLAAVLFVIVVYGHNVAGLAGMEDLVLIAIGLLLILVEVFLLPGFGVAGITGLVCLVWGLIQAMTLRYPGNPGEWDGLVAVENFNTAVMNVGLGVIGSTLGIVLVMRSLNTNNLFGRRLVLAEILDPAEADPAVAGLAACVGQSGTAQTPLTPSGTVEVDGAEYDALSDSEYVDAGVPVRVLEIHNRRLIVTALPGEST